LGRQVRPRTFVSAPEAGLAAFVQQAGLAERGEEGDWTPLSGGVSSDIWRVSLRSGDYCVKRALAQLKVAADWSAPVDRNEHEWNYMKVADRLAPGRVPRPIAHDPARGLFAMAWLAPDRHRLWKTELLEGRVDSADAAALGALVAHLHAGTASELEIARAFATDANFHALRIEPYLLATADKHPALGEQLRAIAASTARTRLALVHGDVSPKNILLGPDGPVLLDAECAWYGDPAFDFAFCLNHLAIKARVVSGARELLSQAFDAFTAAYLAGVTWEPPGALERRASALVPALALARVDGKSPLEYLDDDQRQALRSVAAAALSARFQRLSEVKDALLG
jgi:aminoglycoside phosphotransferase (APT) family kinase protein